MSTFDLLPWQGTAHAFACPARLAAHAQLRGLPTAPPETCTYLELQCGDGTHALNLALRFPHASIYALDGSPRACALLRERAQSLGVTNLSILTLDLSEHTGPLPLPTMDYIVCHGQLSWVTPKARQKLLQAISQLLSPSGLAVLSFLVLPGQHELMPLLELMRHHTASTHDPLQKVEQALAIAGFQVERLAQQGGAAQALLPDSLLHEWRQLSPEALFHDLLAPERHPQTLLKLCDETSPLGLRYFGNARMSEPRLSAVDASFHADIRALSTSEERQHALDHLLLTRFRTALFCHVSAQLDHQVDAAMFAGFYGLSLVPSETLDDPTAPIQTSTGLHTLSLTQHELLKTLSAQRPQSPLLLSLGEPEALGADIAALWQMDAIELLSAPVTPQFNRTHPCAYSLARLLAAHGVESLPTQTGRMAYLDASARNELLACDGKRPRESFDTDLLALFEAAGLLS